MITCVLKNDQACFRRLLDGGGPPGLVPTESPIVLGNSGISDEAKQLLRGLLHAHHCVRLGSAHKVSCDPCCAQVFKQLTFFKDVNWNDAIKKRLEVCQDI
jgi:hypothetical protein